MGINFYDQIKEIENSPFQKVSSKTEDRAFELRAEKWLVNDLSGNYGALFVRAMLHELNINEHHVLKWRLENKFRQYRVFDYYYPGCMPESLSFSELLKENRGIQKINSLFSNGFFLKSTLGDASLLAQSWDKTAQFSEILKLPNISDGEYEVYMVQKKLSLLCEFRVHTFSKEIIPALTYVVQGENEAINLLTVEKFVQEVLQKLPDTILQGTLIAWDIALTADGKYYIIEGNFTGFHPEYRKGFQTTGYVDNHRYGAIICAWLNLYFKMKFGIYVDAIEDSLFLNYPFYRAMVYYMSILKSEHFDLFENNRKKNSTSIILYLGDDENELVVYLIKHFLLVGFAKKYYVIVRDEYFLKMKDVIGTTSKVQVLVESYLFTQQQYNLVKQLGYDRRKQISCYHAIRRIKDKSGVII